MLKLLKNLKNSFWSVVIIIAFLCIQSQTDLLLPEYTSKIVNVGIQSGGIENPIPEVISQEDMNLIKMFSKEDAENIQNSYKKVTDELNKQEEKTAKKFLGDNYKEKDAYVLSRKLKQRTKRGII